MYMSFPSVSLEYISHMYKALFMKQYIRGQDFWYYAQNHISR